jgi:hypothetical protein
MQRGALLANWCFSKRYVMQGTGKPTKRRNSMSCEKIQRLCIPFVATNFWICWENKFLNRGYITQCRGIIVVVLLGKPTQESVVVTSQFGELSCKLSHHPVLGTSRPETRPMSWKVDGRFWQTKCFQWTFQDPKMILDDGWPESVEEQGLLLLVWRHHIRNNILKMCYRQSRRGVLRQNSRSARQ